MGDHPVDSRDCNDGVAEIISELFDVDVGGNARRGFAVPAIDNLVKETGVGGIMLFQAIEAHGMSDTVIVWQPGRPCVSSAMRVCRTTADLRLRPVSLQNG
jgi:hypothetical protein